MSESNEPSVNPYEPPAQTYTPSAEAQAHAANAYHRDTTEKISKFREQMHALGALWIIIGGLAIGLSFYGLSEFPAGDDATIVVMGLMSVIGLLWLSIGIATCFKLIGAVYVGLAISYLSLVSNILSLNICGTCVVIVVILQAHRVIIWSRELRNQRIPLNSKPQ